MDVELGDVSRLEIILCKLGIVRARRYEYLLNKYIETAVENQRLTQMLDWTHNRDEIKVH